MHTSQISMLLCITRRSGKFAYQLRTISIFDNGLSGYATVGFISNAAFQIYVQHPLQSSYRSNFVVMLGSILKTRSFEVLFPGGNPTPFCFLYLTKMRLSQLSVLRSCLFVVLKCMAHVLCRWFLPQPGVCFAWRSYRRHTQQSRVLCDQRAHLECCTPQSTIPCPQRPETFYWRFFLSSNFAAWSLLFNVLCTYSDEVEANIMWPTKGTRSLRFMPVNCFEKVLIFVKSHSDSDKAIWSGVHCVRLRFSGSRMGPCTDGFH